MVFINTTASYGAESTFFWLRPYEDFLRFYGETEEFTYTEIPTFFKSATYFYLTSFVKYNEAACLENSPQCITSFFFMTNFHDHIKYHELIPAVQDWRRIANKHSDFQIYAYSDHSPFVDQTTEIGSGIVKRMDEVTGGNADKSRLAKLKNLQEKPANLIKRTFSTVSKLSSTNLSSFNELHSRLPRILHGPPRVTKPPFEMTVLDQNGKPVMEYERGVILTRSIHSLLIGSSHDAIQLTEKTATRFNQLNTKIKKFTLHRCKILLPDDSFVRLCENFTSVSLIMPVVRNEPMYEHILSRILSVTALHVNHPYIEMSELFTKETFKASILENNFYNFRLGENPSLTVKEIRFLVEAIIERKAVFQMGFGKLSNDQLNDANEWLQYVSQNPGLPYQVEIGETHPLIQSTLFQITFSGSVAFFSVK